MILQMKIQSSKDLATYCWHGSGLQGAGKKFGEWSHIVKPTLGRMKYAHAYALRDMSTSPLSCKSPKWRRSGVCCNQANSQCENSCHCNMEHKMELCVNMKFCFKLCKTAMETHGMLVDSRMSSTIMPPCNLHAQLSSSTQGHCSSTPSLFSRFGASRLHFVSLPYISPEMLPFIDVADQTTHDHGASRDSTRSVCWQFPTVLQQMSEVFCS